jgi:hypothetical protein
MSQGSAAELRLAETAVFVDAAGHQFTVTRFIISPQGTNECTLELPNGQRLIRITLDGRPALARSLDHRSWQVQLGPPNLPQTLEIVSRSIGEADMEARFVELSRPVITQSGQPIRAEISLWSLSRPNHRRQPRAVGAAAQTAAEQAVLRLDRLVGISRKATRPAMESPVIDGFHWFAKWAGQLRAASQAVQSFEHSVSGPGPDKAIRVAPPSSGAIPDPVALAEAWIQQFEDVFADAESMVSQLDSLPGNEPDPWRLTDWDFGMRSCFVADGGQDRLRVEYLPMGLTPAAIRFAVLSSISLVAVAVLWLMRAPAAIEFARKRPQAFGIAAGLFAWAWLWPSALGLVVAVVSLSLLLRRSLLEAKSPRHDSTKQLSTTPEELAKP